VEEIQYKQLATNVDELWLRALLATAYAFGFRKGELLNLRVRQISLIDRTIRLDPGATKNDEPRVVVMTNDVFVLLQACVAGKGADDFVFTRPHGNPVRVFRDDWEALCCESGLGRMVCPECSPATTVDDKRKCPACSQTWKAHQVRYVGLLFHDLRRSAVRNMIRRGVTRSRCDENQRAQDAQRVRPIQRGVGTRPPRCGPNDRIAEQT